MSIVLLVFLPNFQISYAKILYLLLSFLQFNSDVLACKRDSNSDTVAVIDTWNPNSYSNMLDASQLGICQHTTQYNNGRISCT